MAASNDGCPYLAMRIVAVDDSPVCLHSIGTALRAELGARVAAFTCPGEALDYLGCHPVDLLVCDMLMPVLNGEALIRAVRRQPGLGYLPTLLVTAHDNHAWLVENTPPLLDVIFKPIEPVALACRARMLIATYHELRRLERRCHTLERRLFQARGVTSPA